MSKKEINNEKICYIYLKNKEKPIEFIIENFIDSYLDKLADLFAYPDITRIKTSDNIIIIRPQDISYIKICDWDNNISNNKIIREDNILQDNDNGIITD